MSNQLKVKVVNEKVVLPDSFAGIDVSNVIASPNSASYTAIQDCYITYGPGSDGVWHTYTINGVEWSQHYKDTTGKLVLLKEGQTASGTGGTSPKITKVFGLKY